MLWQYTQTATVSRRYSLLVADHVTHQLNHVTTDSALCCAGCEP